MKQVESLHSNSVSSLHNDAMRAAEQAMVARQNGNLERSHELFQQALAYEREAAYLLLDERDKEPSRSVLFRSAASLALDCGYWIEAGRIALDGLDGNPPEQIAEELRDILEHVVEWHRPSYEVSAEGEMYRYMNMRRILGSESEKNHLILKYRLEDPPMTFEAIGERLNMRPDVVRKRAARFYKKVKIAWKKYEKEQKDRKSSQ